jgi:hypothetical protein
VENKKSSSLIIIEKGVEKKKKRVMIWLRMSVDFPYVIAIEVHDNAKEIMV